MKLHTKVALIAAALTLGISTAAMAGPQYGPDYTPAPPPHGEGHAKGHEHAKAYGFHCKGFSKKHVKGQKGTPFSQCVKGVAQMRKEQQEVATASAV